METIKTGKHFSVYLFYFVLIFSTKNFFVFDVKHLTFFVDYNRILYGDKESLAQYIVFLRQINDYI